MKNEKLQPGIEEIKKLGLASDEKARMLNFIFNTPVSKPIPSPFMKYSFISVLTKNRLVFYGALSCLVVVLGGGVTFASGRSLPGSVLYPIKVNVLEPLGGTFQFSTEAKAKYESNLTTKRLVETETLIKENNLDYKKKQKLNNLLNDQTKSLNNSLNQLHQNGRQKEAEEIDKDFHTSLDVHMQALDILNTDNSNNQNHKKDKENREDIKDTLKNINL